jgi:hypothetical protein
MTTLYLKFNLRKLVNSDSHCGKLLRKVLLSVSSFYFVLKKETRKEMLIVLQEVCRESKELRKSFSMGDTKLSSEKMTSVSEFAEELV